MKCHFSLFLLLLVSGSLLLLSGCLQTPTLACFPCENDSQCAAPLTCSPRLKRCVALDGAADQCDGAGESGGTEKNDERLPGDGGAEQVAEQAAPSEFGGDAPVGEGLSQEGVADEPAQPGEQVAEAGDGSPPQEPVVTDVEEGVREQVSSEPGPEPVLPEERGLESIAEQSPDSSLCEQDAKLNTACSAGQGVCKGAGKWVCSADKQRVVCDAKADPTRSKAEDCNGVDDDCDGMVDDGIAAQSCYTGAAGTKGVGRCKAGTRSCQGGKWSACNGEVVPIAEDCKNCVDDDCDGMVNEACSWVLAFTAGSKVVQGRAVTADKQCNTYVAANYSGVPTVGNTMLPNAGNGTSMFVAKVAPDRRVMWAATQSGSTYAIPSSVGVDSAGNTYIVGRARAPIKFGGLPQLTGTNGLIVGYIAKLSPSGKYLWAQSFSSKKGGVHSIHARTTPSGVTYVFGHFNNDLQYANKSISASDIYYSDLFVAKIGPHSGVAWLVRGGNNYAEYANGLALSPQGNLYIVGSFVGSSALGSLRLSGPSSSATYPFAAMMNHIDGSFLWAYQLQQSASSSDGKFTGVATDQSANVYIVGTYRKDVTFDAGATIKLASASTYDQLFVLKLNTIGKPQWALGSNSSGSTIPYRVAVDSQGSAIVTGRFSRTLQLGAKRLFADGNFSYGFLARVAADGKSFVGAAQSTSPAKDGSTYPLDMFLGPGQVLLIGQFRNSAKFDTTTLRSTADSAFVWQTSIP